jgi:hypothetical protein
MGPGVIFLTNTGKDFLYINPPSDAFSLIPENDLEIQKLNKARCLKASGPKSST